MKSFLSFISKITLVVFGVSSFSTSSELSHEDRDRLGAAYGVLVTAPIVTPLMAYAGNKTSVATGLSVAMNAGSVILSQYTLTKLVDNGRVIRKNEMSKITGSPHFKPKLIAGISAFGSLFSSTFYILTGDNFYRWINIACSTVSTISTMYGTMTLYEDKCPDFIESNSYKSYSNRFWDWMSF